MNVSNHQRNERPSNPEESPHNVFVCLNSASVSPSDHPERVRSPLRLELFGPDIKERVAPIPEVGGTLPPAEQPRVLCPKIDDLFSTQPRKAPRPTQWPIRKDSLVYAAEYRRMVTTGFNSISEHHQLAFESISQVSPNKYLEDPFCAEKKHKTSSPSCSRRKSKRICKSFRSIRRNIQTVKLKHHSRIRPRFPSFSARLKTNRHPLTKKRPRKLLHHLLAAVRAKLKRLTRRRQAPPQTPRPTTTSNTTSSPTVNPFCSNPNPPCSTVTTAPKSALPTDPPDPFRCTHRLSHISWAGLAPMAEAEVEMQNSQRDPGTLSSLQSPSIPDLLSAEQRPGSTVSSTGRRLRVSPSVANLMARPWAFEVQG